MLSIQKTALVYVFLLSTMVPTIVAQDTPNGQNIQSALEKLEFSAALKLCEDGIKAQPNNVELNRMQAKALRGLDRVAEIPDAIGEAIQAHPRASDLILQRALAFKSLGKFSEMAADCRLLDTLGEGLGFVLIAQLAEEKDDSIAAIHAYTRLMEIYPEDDDFSDWKSARARHLMAINVVDWANADLRYRMERSPTLLELLSYGEILARNGQIEAAEQVLQKFFDGTDQDYVGEIRRMNVLFEMGNFDMVRKFLGDYEVKYRGKDEAKHAASIRTRLKQNDDVRQQVVAAAKKRDRLSGFELAEQVTAEQQRMQQLARTTDPEERKELKRLILRQAQYGMDNENAEFAGMMLKSLATLKGKIEFTTSEQARQLTIQAWLQMQADDYDQALETVSKAVQLDAQHGDAHRVMASILYMTDQNESALKAASKSIAADPMNVVNHGYRGLIQTDLGNMKDAATDLSEAYRLGPQNPWVTSLLSNLFKVNGKYETAIIYHCRPIENCLTGNYLDRCELFLSAKLPQLATLDAMDYAENVEDGDKARAAAIAARGVYLWFSQTLQYQVGGPRVDEVIQACQKAAELHPKEPKFFAMLSDMHRFKGEYAQAIEAMEHTLGLGADNASIFYQLAGLHLADGNLKGARAANMTVQAIKYPDAQSQALQQELAIIVPLAVELEATLKRTNFRTESGKALGQLLATADDTAQVFDSEHAAKVDSVYEKMRPQAALVKSPPAENTQLRLQCVSTEDLRLQDATLFGFDAELASIANNLKDGHHWFSVEYTTPDKSSGRSFAYFVKLKAGWRVFPQPWQTK